jgi:hypothetical protein
VLSVSAITVPFALGIIFGAIYFDVFRGPNTDSVQFCVFLGSALAITAFPVLARMLQENNLIKTKLGSIRPEYQYAHIGQNGRFLTVSHYHDRCIRRKIFFFAFPTVPEKEPGAA